MHPAQALDMEWDDYNELHLARHNISADEAMQVYENAPLWLPDLKSEESRWLMVGRTDGGRWLSIVVEVNEATRHLRAFTGTDAASYHRTLYRRQRGSRR